MFIRFPFFSSLGTVEYSFHHKFAPMSCTGDFASSTEMLPWWSRWPLWGKRITVHLSLNLNALLYAIFSCHFMGSISRDLENYEIVKARVVLGEVIDPSLMTIVHTGISLYFVLHSQHIWKSLSVSNIYLLNEVACKLVPNDWFKFHQCFLTTIGYFYSVISRYNDYTRLSVPFQVIC